MKTTVPNPEWAVKLVHKLFPYGYVQHKIVSEAMKKVLDNMKKGDKNG